MDQDSQNQSVDGMKPVDGGVPTSGVDGFMAPPKPKFNMDEEETKETDNNIEEQTPAPVVGDGKKSSKAKVWIIILAVLFVVSAAAAGYFYMQYSTAKNDLNSAQNATSQASTQKQQIDTLTQQNADLQKTVNSQTGYINSLLKVANELKTACGKSCTNIAIPPAPTGVPTPTPSATVSPTPTAKVTPTPTATP